MRCGGKTNTVFSEGFIGSLGREVTNGLAEAEGSVDLVGEPMSHRGLWWIFDVKVVGVEELGGE